MYHFFTDPGNIELYTKPDSAADAPSGIVRIEGGDVNHIRNVLRMKVGDELLISDGQGMDYVCEISSFEGSADDGLVVLNITGAGTSLTEPSVRFYLFQGLPKSDKFEHIIQKSVELGVYEIIPVQTSRSIVRYDDKKARSKKERWQKIAESAAKQSRRGIIPEVKDIMTFSEALKYAVADDEQRLNIIPYENFKDMKATREILSEIQPGMSVGIFIGPEGGFDEKEIETANAAGVRCISLGNRILRTETAPLMLLSVLTFALD